jgi:hypothetical protein
MPLLGISSAADHRPGRLSAPRRDERTGYVKDRLPMDVSATAGTGLTQRCEKETKHDETLISAHF